MLTNAADTDQEWVRGFLLRLGYLLAAEYQFMPKCELRDLVGHHSNELIDLAQAGAEDDAATKLTVIHGDDAG